MYCIQCGSPLEAQATVYPSCAADVRAIFRQTESKNTGKPKYCKSCVSQVAEKDLFCHYCGKALPQEQKNAPAETQRRCKRCGTPMSKREKSCLWCGHDEWVFDAKKYKFADGVL